MFQLNCNDTLYIEFFFSVAILNAGLEAHTLTLDPRDKCPSQMSAAPAPLLLCNVTLDNKCSHVENSCCCLASIVSAPLPPPLKHLLSGIQ